VRFHDLRHTYVSLLIRAGANVKEVSTWAGHSSVAFTLDRYGHVYNVADDSVSERLDALLAGAAAPRSDTAARPAALMIGKRQRNRARTTALTKPAAASMSSRTLQPAQQMARVNVDPATWAEFRVAALRSGRSVADYLGELVRRELGR
jgi:hypothetical protein